MMREKHIERRSARQKDNEMQSQTLSDKHRQIQRDSGREIDRQAMRQESDKRNRDGDKRQRQRDT